jgi:hypothetical protein
MMLKANVEQVEKAFFVFPQASGISALLGLTPLWHTISTMTQKLVHEVLIFIGVSVSPLDK